MLGGLILTGPMRKAGLDQWNAGIPEANPDRATTRKVKAVAILSLWIHSSEMKLTAENCESLLQAIARAAKAPVNFQIHKKPKYQGKSYKTSYLQITGIRIQKKFWPRLIDACKQVIDGTDATFQYGWRWYVAILKTRAIPHYCAQEGLLAMRLGDVG